MSILLGSNIHVQTTKPLDDKYVAADDTARDAILAGERYLGMQVFVTATGLTWQLKTGITNSDWVAFGSGSGSPLTTKGDLFGFSTVDARIAVGTNGKILTADSTAATGVSWQTPTVAGVVSTSTVTGSGTVTVPTGATKALVEGCGGGQGGDAGIGNQSGGRGAYYYSTMIAAQAGQVMTVAIGAGGAAVNPGTGGAGGDTTLKYSVGPAIVTFPGASSTGGTGYPSATASPFYTYGSSSTFNGATAYGGGGGPYGVGANGLSGNNNFVGYSAAANTGAGGGAASAGSNGQSGAGGSGKMIITWMY